MESIATNCAHEWSTFVLIFYNWLFHLFRVKNVILFGILRKLNRFAIGRFIFFAHWYDSFFNFWLEFIYEFQHSIAEWTHSLCYFQSHILRKFTNFIAKCVFLFPKTWKLLLKRLYSHLPGIICLTYLQLHRNRIAPTADLIDRSLDCILDTIFRLIETF